MRIEAIGTEVLTDSTDLPLRKGEDFDSVVLVVDGVTEALKGLSKR